MKTQRLQKLQKEITNPLLIKKKENLFYLTGRSFDHRAEEYLLVTKKDAVAFGSGLEQIDWIKKTDQLRNIGKYLQPGTNLDIEYAFTYGEGNYLKAKLPKVKIKPAVSRVAIARQVKDSGELALIAKSMHIVEKVFWLIPKEIKKPGMTEVKLAKFIESWGKKFGAEDVSFPAIAAAGPNAAIPHHVPGNKKFTAGESIILDFGFQYKGYCSDFTRTVFLKNVPKKLAQAYRQTEKAYIACMQYASRPNVTGNDLYQKAVDILAEKRINKYFIHSLGHGTGLEIHELPNLSPKSKDVLTNGMVFSIEPGVYFPKQGGIRIEDLVYLEKGNCKKFIQISTRLEDNVF